MAATDLAANEKLDRTSSVFSTLLDDFETTPGNARAPSNFILSWMKIRIVLFDGTLIPTVVTGK